jgi:PAS domain S-box-containing protein
MRTAFLAGFGLFLVAAAVIFSWYSQHHMQKILEPKLAEITEFRYLVTSTYLVSEKIAARDTTAKYTHVEQYLSSIDSLRNHAALTLSSKSMMKVPGLSDAVASAFRTCDSLEKLLQFRHAGTDDTFNHSYDRTFDSLFSTFRSQLYTAEQKLQQAIINRFQQFLIIQLLLLLSCVSVAIAIGYLYFLFARRHRQDLESLEKAHGDLDRAFKEKVSSEQQLKAANQQLRANEQQLKAANQQLKAHEQQLRAVNQQLRASEQQLKATNQQLKANEQVLRIYKKSIDHAEDLVSAVSARYEFIFINGAFERYYGVSQASIAGKTVPDVMGEEEFLATAKKNIDRAFRGERIQYEIIHSFAGLRPRFMQVSYYPLLGDDGTAPIVILVLRDITDRKKAEEERQKMQRLETVGQRAAGIAHDFNNILGGVFGFISLAKMSLSGQKDVAQYLEGALSAYKRAKDLTQQLLTFSRGGLPVKKRMFVDPIIKEAAHLSLSGSKVRSVLGISDDLCPVDIDDSQVFQVLNNLIINARQAMPDGGEITIHAKNREIKQGEIPEVDAGRYVQITVRDSGIGIASEHLSRIFEPFFTTKQQGSGLGLSICFSIIKNHGGHIAVESELGKGTAFFVLLPAVEGDIQEQVKPVAGPAVGTGSILVMDDDEHVLFVTEQILSRSGYTVTTAKNGHEAISIFENERLSGKTFKAVVLDLTIMGGMGGLETFMRLRKIDPQVRGIVTSGYSNDPVMADFKTYGFVAAVKKPFYTDEIVGAVEKAAFWGG